MSPWEEVVEPGLDPKAATPTMSAPLCGTVVGTHSAGVLHMESDPLELPNTQRGKQPPLLIKQVRISMDAEFCNWIKDGKY